MKNYPTPQAYHNPPPLGMFLTLFLYPAGQDHSAIYHLLDCDPTAPPVLYLATRCTDRAVVAALVETLCARIYALTPNRPAYHLTPKQADHRHRADTMIQRLTDFRRLRAAALHVQINGNASSHANLQHAINVLSNERIAALVTELLRQIASLETKPNLVAMLAVAGAQ